jgi:tripartite-type tricarboxylate transporter receptor subunit TctC
MPACAKLASVYHVLEQGGDMNGMRASPVAVLFGLLIAAVQPIAQAQNGYPSKPLTFIVPDGIGGVIDLRARQIAPKLAEALGQPVVVENRPGGNMFVGAQAAAHAPNDGHTLFFGNFATHSLNPWLFKSLPYRPDEDFIPVTLVTMGPIILLANPQVEARSMRELIDLAKSRPGQLNYAALGKGSASHLIMEQIRAITGAEFMLVQYKATGAYIQDLMAGHVQLGLNWWSVVGPQVKAGRLRALAVAAPRRLAVAPDVPTFAEAGLPGIDGVTWQGLFVPAGTPKPIVARLQTEVALILKLPEIRNSLVEAGGEVGGNSPEEFASFIRADRAAWKKSIDAAGITPE